MMYGFIGYGNMGSIVVKALLKDHSLDPAQVVIYNRTLSRLAALKEEHPGVTIARNASEVAVKTDVLFICTRSGSVSGVLQEIRAALHPGVHLVTINGGVQIKNVERIFAGPITKIVPSVTLEAGRGITLMCHNAKVTRAQAEAMTALFGRSSKVKLIAEEQFEIAADLTSCGPGLITDMMEKFASVGAEKGNIPCDEALEMVLETMLGTAVLLADRRIPPEELKAMVATKGGITEQGLRVLDRELPKVYDLMFRVALAKHEMVKNSITEEFERSC